MTNYQQQKQNIKRFLIAIENNKISESELLALKNKLGSLSISELRSLKEVIKDLVKERIGLELETLMNSKATTWNPWSELKWLESELKDYYHALVNLAFSIFDENVFREAMILENKTELSMEEKAKRFIPILIQQVNKITAQKKSTTISNYERVENSVIGKWEEIFSLKKQSLEKQSSSAEKENVRKAVNILKNLSDDEIRVSKEKLKKVAIDHGNLLAIKFGQENIAEIKKVFKFCIELADVILDDEVIINFWRTIGDFYDEISPRLENTQKPGKLIWKEFQLAHNQAKIKKISQQFTQHLNNLAGETGNQISEETKELIASEINSIQDENGRSDQQADLKNHFGFLRLLGNSSSYLSSPELLGGVANFISQIKPEELENALTSHQGPKKMSTGKKIGLLVFFGFLIGGTISLFLYSQKRKR